MTPPSLSSRLWSYLVKNLKREPSAEREEDEDEEDSITDTWQIYDSSVLEIHISPLPQRVAVVLDTAPVSREVAEEHSWNSYDRSLNVVLKEDDPLTVRRHPVAQSTDCIRGKIGYSSGIHLWEVTWPVRQRGTHAVVGVATRETVLHSVGYQSLVGNTEHSWGWDLGRKKAYHNSRAEEGPDYPAMDTQSLNTYHWTVPDTFNMVLDMDTGKLGFVIKNQFLGWSHLDVKSGKTVYPIVNTVWGHCEVKLKYLCGLEQGEMGLQALAKTAIRTALGRSRKDLDSLVETLRLPTLLKNYLKNDDAKEASTLNNNDRKAMPLNTLNL